MWQPMKWRFGSIHPVRPVCPKVCAALQATADTYGAQVLGLVETDSLYSAAKLFFAYGLGNAMTFPMSVGVTAAYGYWNQCTNSRVTFEGEWTRTRDKYELIAAGRYVYCGRTDDMFKVSGIWVSPFEVEQSPIAHPSVLEAAVVPNLDPAGLAKPKSYIVLKAGDGDGFSGELQDFVKDKIGNWKYPGGSNLFRACQIQPPVKSNGSN